MVGKKFAGAVWVWVVMATVLVSGCGGGGGGSSGSTGGGTSAPVPSNATYSVSGSVTGLASGTSVVLQNNGGDNVTVNANGTFVFPTSLATGAAYSVTVLTQPTAQTCTVSNGTGTINGANVTNVSVVCATSTYSVSGTVSGLSGVGLVLLDNGGDPLTVNANGSFTFATKVAVGASYNVTVGTQPTGPSQTCTVSGGTGTMGTANVTGVTVACSTNAYAVSGTVSGLSGAGLVLQDNNGDNLSITANGAFTFATAVASGSSYNVTVFTQPTNPSQTCTVTNGSGTIGSANVSNVAVSCTTNTYTISGTVTGLAGTGLVLLDNGGDNLPISANGTFTFTTPIASNGSYNVTVGTQPGGPTQTCAVNSGTGIVTGSNITNVSVICSTNTYTVSGSVTGLSGTGLVLQDNGGDNLSVAANGSFTFSTPVPSGATYTVTVLTQPTSPAQTCTVTNYTGTVVSSNITNVAVNCSTNSYTVSATVTGLAGTGLVLMNNGADFLNVSANGTYTFATPVISGGTYNVAVSSQPTGPTQTCSVTNGMGTVTSANITNVSVVCSTNTYTVGGSVTGLAGTGLVLQNNGADNLSINANGSFTFATPVASGAGYNVTVLTQPTGQLCTVIGGTGTVVSANITTVSVSCVNAYTIGGTVSGLTGLGLVLQDNGGDNLSVAANGTFTFATPLATGATYNVSVFNQPNNQVCSVTGGTGSVAGANVTSVAVNCVTASPRYVLSADSGGGTVSSYVVDPATSRLTYLGKVPSGTTGTNGSDPNFVAVDHAGKYAYALNTNAGNIGEFAIGPDGRLTPIGIVTLPSGVGPQMLAIDPSGRYAYLANNAGSVLQYAIGVNGLLMPMATPAIVVGTTPWFVTVDPSGRYVYVVDPYQSTVWQFTIGAGGALTPMSAAGAPAASSPRAMTIDPTGKYAYVSGSNSISQYTIGADGALTLMSPTGTFTGGGNSTSLTVDPTGRYVYVAGGSSNFVTEYTVGAGGALTFLASMPTPSTAASVVVDPTGTYAYVANQSGGSIGMYRIGATGMLSPVPGVLAVTNPSAGVLAMTQGNALVAGPQYAYVANGTDNTVGQYTIGASGSLTSMSTSAVAAGVSPDAIVVDPAHQFAYVANKGSNAVSQYAIGTDGSLTLTATLPVGTAPVALALDPLGEILFVANSGSNDVSVYRLYPGGSTFRYSCGSPGTTGCSGATTPTNWAAGTTPVSIAVVLSNSTAGSLQLSSYVYVLDQGNNNVSFGTSYGTSNPLSQLGLLTNIITTGASPNAIRIDPTGQYLYVTNSADNTVSQFLINRSTGILSAMTTPTVGAGTLPDGLALDPSGQYCYVVNHTSNDVWQYTLGAGGGLVSMVTPSIAAGSAPTGLAIDASGRFVYVTNSLSNNISQYAIGAGGALSSLGTAAAGTGPSAISTLTNWH